MAKILIVGAGNLLRRDDGFGVEVAKRLLARGDLPHNVKIIEVGIAGISLVQELLDGYDALIVVDAVDRGEAPGTTYLMEPKVPDLDFYNQEELTKFLADMHDMEPSKALILAEALGVLPSRVLLVGCQPLDHDELGVGLSEPVERAVDRAVEEIAAFVKKLTGQTSEPSGEDA